MRLRPSTNLPGSIPILKWSSIFTASEASAFDSQLNIREVCLSIWSIQPFHNLPHFPFICYWAVLVKYLFRQLAVSLMSMFLFSQNIVQYL